jgi:hypothetical protein
VGGEHWPWALVPAPKTVVAVVAGEDSATVALTCLEKQLRSREPDERAGKMCACRAALGRSGRSRSPVWVDWMCVPLGL